MPRITDAPVPSLSSEMQDIYNKITGPQSDLSSTYKMLFTNPGVGLGIARLQETIDALDLEPWVTYTVGLTVAHEREDKGLWDAILPLAQDAGVSDPVLDGLGKGPALGGYYLRTGYGYNSHWTYSEGL